MRAFVTGTLVVVVLLACASTLEAQREVRRSGFWIGFGVGGGWSRQVDSGVDAEPGGAGYFRLGWTLSDRFLLGGEIGLWVRQEESESRSRTNTTAIVLFYPSRSGGFFLKGGLGPCGENHETTVGNTTYTVTESGLGTTVGLGYDVRLGRRLSLTPNLDIQAQDFDNYRTNALVFMLGLSWH